MTGDTIDLTQNASPRSHSRVTAPPAIRPGAASPPPEPGYNPLCPVTPQLLPALPQGRLGAPATAPAYQEAQLRWRQPIRDEYFPALPPSPGEGRARGRASGPSRAGRHQPPSVPPPEPGPQGLSQKTGTFRWTRTYCWREFSIHGPVTAFPVSAWRGCLVVALSDRPRTELRGVPHPGLVYCWESVVVYTSLSSGYLFPAIASTGKTRFHSKSYPTFQIASCHNLHKFGVI